MIWHSKKIFQTLWKSYYLLKVFSALLLKKLKKEGWLTQQHRAE